MIIIIGSGLILLLLILGFAIGRAFLYFAAISLFASGIYALVTLKRWEDKKAQIIFLIIGIIMEAGGGILLLYLMF